MKTERQDCLHNWESKAWCVCVFIGFWYFLQPHWWMCHLLTSDYFEMSSHGQPISVFKDPVPASVSFFSLLRWLCKDRCPLWWEMWSRRLDGQCIFWSLFFFKNLCSKWGIVWKKKKVHVEMAREMDDIQLPSGN